MIRVFVHQSGAGEDIFDHVLSVTVHSYGAVYIGTVVQNVVKSRFQRNALSKINNMPQDAAVIFFFTGLEVFSITDLTAIVHQNDIFKTGLRQLSHESDHPFVWIQGGNNNGCFVIKCPHNLLL